MNMLLTSILIKLGLVVLGGYLWKKGGSGYKWCRRIVLPAIMGIHCLFVTSFNWIAFVLTSALLGIGTGQGYGIPDQTDAGSRIARFWMKICKIDLTELLSNPKKYRKIRILTRATVAFFYSLGLIPKIVLGASVWWTIPIMIVGVPFIVELDLGEWEERIIGGFVILLYVL